MDTQTYDRNIQQNDYIQTFFYLKMEKLDSMLASTEKRAKHPNRGILEKDTVQVPSFKLRQRLISGANFLSLGRFQRGKTDRQR